MGGSRKRWGEFWAKKEGVWAKKDGGLGKERRGSGERWGGGVLGEDGGLGVCAKKEGGLGKDKGDLGKEREVRVWAKMWGPGGLGKDWVASAGPCTSSGGDCKAEGVAKEEWR